MKDLDYDLATYGSIVDGDFSITLSSGISSAVCMEVGRRSSHPWWKGGKRMKDGEKGTKKGRER